MAFVFVEELSEVFEQALGKRIITPVLLGDPGEPKDGGVVVPMRMRTARKRVGNGKRIPQGDAL
jgi:hypothetical protein